MSLGTVCVIGCSGFVGSHVTAKLLKRGYSVNGTLRDSKGSNAEWLRTNVSCKAISDNSLRLFSADVFDKESLRLAMADCTGIIVCAGSPVIAPETINLMVAVGKNTSEIAIESGIERAVYTSSTGSTNPPEGEPELKNEEIHWSDPIEQYDAGKFAAVGKTRMDRIVLESMKITEGSFRVCVINPSMIVGPAYQLEPVTSLIRFADIINGRRFKDRIPNSSNSIIDVRDLAELHINALENEDSRGRYFGVKRSWHWREILREIEIACPDYTMANIDPAETPVMETQFDFSRQKSLGVSIRGIKDMFKDLIKELYRRNMI